MWILFLLIFGHFLADYPWQGEFLALGKNRNTAIGKQFWVHALTAHSFIHAGVVGSVIGFVGGDTSLGIILGLVEFVIHALTDFTKCEDNISLNVDQAIHIGCKILWTLVFLNLHNF